MPKSFLVRMNQTMENSTADSTPDMHELDGKKESEPNTPMTTFIPLVDSSEQVPWQSERIFRAEQQVILANKTPTATALEQSHIHVMKSSHYNQWNPAIGMTTLNNNQSQNSTVTAHHPVGPACEMAIPPPYHAMPSFYPIWYQYDWLPMNVNTWCHPHHMPHIGDLPAKYPGKGERLLHQGEVALPVYSHNTSVYKKTNQEKESFQPSQRCQDRESKQHIVSDSMEFTGAYNEFFSVEHMFGTKQPKKDYTASPAVALELLPRSQIHSGDHVKVGKPSNAYEKPEEQQTMQNMGKTAQTYEVSISEQKNEDNRAATVSCITTSRHPDSVTAQQPSTNSEKNHVCKQCNKAFNRASNLRAHMKTHSEHKPYKCDYCGKGFHQKIDKRIHHYTHTGEKPHKCKKCGRGFKQLTHLNYHMRTHSDTHMYHCTYCGKGFNQKGNLQAHIYGHTGQRPFKCEICGKGFTLRSTLNTHLRTHAPKKPFVCEYCNKAFYQKNALKMHHIASHPMVNGKSIL